MIWICDILLVKAVSPPKAEHPQGSLNGKNVKEFVAIKKNSTFFQAFDGNTRAWTADNPEQAFSILMGPFYSCSEKKSLLIYNL